MTKTTDFQLPTSFRVTIRQIDGELVRKPSHLVLLANAKRILVRVEAIGPIASPIPQEFELNPSEFREMLHPVSKVPGAEMSGEAGVSLGEFELAREWIDNIMRERQWGHPA